MGDDSPHQPAVATAHVPPQKQRSSRLLPVTTPGGPSSDPPSLARSPSPGDHGQWLTKPEGVVGTGRRPSSLGRIVSSQSLKNTWKLKYHDFLPVDGGGGRRAVATGGATGPERTESFQLSSFKSLNRLSAFVSAWQTLSLCLHLAYCMLCMNYISL